MTTSNTYATAGVDISAGQRAVDLMADAVRATYGPEVLAGIGAFGGLYDGSHIRSMQAPVLVASTDGVGTKTMVAARIGRWDTIGRDLVNHCINDILVQGAEPLFFLDYVASSKLDPAQVASVVNGVALACKEAGCALLGGETAEMPGVYAPGELDLAGMIVGVVERSHIVDGSRIRAGDAILGIPSTGLHTNGYSLARRILAQLDWNVRISTLVPSIIDSAQTIGDALLAIHRSYLPSIRRLWQADIDIHGMAHITGGGFIDNLPRILPDNTAAVLQRGAWPELPIFQMLEQIGNVAEDELFHVFNMGLGMLLVVSPDQAEIALNVLPGDLFRVGEIVQGSRTVTIVHPGINRHAD